MNNKPLIHVQVGDTVRADFGTLFSFDAKRCTVFRVVEITKRYGGANPLLKTGRADGHPWTERDAECPYLDQSFVVEVIERAKWAPVQKPNVFRKNSGRRVHIPASGRHGDFALELVCDIIGSLDVCAETPLDEEKASRALLRAEGLIRFERHGGITVNIKRFKNWVRKNYTRLLMTAKDADKAALHEEEERHKDYIADCEHDLKEEMLRDVAVDAGYPAKEEHYYE